MIGQGFIVVGVNRSGTSAVAAALMELGVYFGPTEDLSKAGPNMDYESFENRHVVEMGGTLLRALEKDGLPARGLPEDWRDYAEVAAGIPHMSEFLLRYFGGHERWGWKDPRTSLLIPFIECAFETVGAKPLYWMPIRHPSEVAEGLRQRQGLPLTEGVGYWIHYTLSVLVDADPGRLEVVNFRDFVAEPRKAIEPILRARGLTDPTEAQWRKVRQAVDPRLDRTRGSSAELPALATRVWDFVASLAAGADLFPGSPKRASLDELAHEWREWSDLTRLSAVSVGEVRWMLADHTSTLAFRAEREWHSCVIKVPQDARGSVSLWFLPRFRIVRVRNIEFGPCCGSGQMKAAVGDSAFAEFVENGDLKLFVFGPNPHLTIEIPTGAEIRELRFEFQVAAGKQSVTEIAQRLATAYSSVRQAAVPAPGRR